MDDSPLMTLPHVDEAAANALAGAGFPRLDRLVEALTGEGGRGGRERAMTAAERILGVTQARELVQV